MSTATEDYEISVVERISSLTNNKLARSSKRDNKLRCASVAMRWCEVITITVIVKVDTLNITNCLVDG